MKTEAEAPVPIVFYQQNASGHFTAMRPSV